MLSVILFLASVGVISYFVSTEKQMFSAIVVGFIIVIYHLSRCAKVLSRFDQNDDGDDNSDNTKKVPPIDEESLEDTISVVNSEEEETSEEVKNKIV